MVRRAGGEPGRWRDRGVPYGLVAVVVVVAVEVAVAAWVVVRSLDPVRGLLLVGLALCT